MTTTRSSGLLSYITTIIHKCFANKLCCYSSIFVRFDRTIISSLFCSYCLKMFLQVGFLDMSLGYDSEDNSYRFHHPRVVCFTLSFRHGVLSTTHPLFKTDEVYIGILPAPRLLRETKDAQNGTTS